MEIFFSKQIPVAEFEDGCYLTQDHVGTNYGSPWNDYDYIVTFKVYLVKVDSCERLGYIKLLAKNENNTSKVFISENPGPVVKITSMLSPEKFISLSSDLDYYRKISNIFKSTTEVEKFLAAVCDASFYYNLAEDFRGWPGFSSSILRSGNASEATLKKGHQIAIGNYEIADKFNVTIANLPSSFDPITLNFDNSEEINSRRVNVLVGKNGVGKSHALRSLVRGVTGIDQTSEPWPFFHKVICIAYSPFEDFFTRDGVATELYNVRVGPIRKDSKSKKERRRLNVNAYAYIGFKNENGDFSLNWPAIQSVISLLKIFSYDAENKWWREKSKFGDLFEALQRHIDFDAVGVRLKDGEILRINVNNQGDKKPTIEALEPSQGITFFLGKQQVNLSSGQKIYSYMLPSLMAEIEDESLILIDEPELYLHPTLEIALLDMLKSILISTKSYAVIATHSPVMVREVDRNAVTILRKMEGQTISTHPSFQTLGESTDRISGEVFDDYYTEKPFQQSVDMMIERQSISIDEIEKISARVGDEALAYAISKISGIDSSKVIIEQP